MAIDPRLIGVVIAELPEAIAALRAAFKDQYPNAGHIPTDEEVIAAFNLAFQASVDKDDAWLKAHPTDT